MSFRFVPACLMVMGIAASSLAGDLNPPAGPVRATMRSLEQVEPRTPINVNTAPPPAMGDAVFQIREPGNYYLESNIVVPAGTSGILVKLSSDPNGVPVIIDLNGFSIMGEPDSLRGVDFQVEFVDGRYVLRSGVPGSVISRCGGDGVHIAGAPPLVDGAPPVIVSGFSVNGNGGDGVHLENVRGASITGISSAGNGGDGIKGVVPQTAGTYVFELIVSDSNGNAGNGLSIEGSGAGATSVEVIRCVTNGNTLDGCRILSADSSINESSSSDNGGHGYFSSDDDLCHLWGADSMAMRNGGDGFHFEDLDPILNHCVSLSNTGDGLEVLSIASNQEQFVVLIDSILSKNGGDGVRLFDVGASMSYCSMIANTGDGVSATTTDPATGGDSKELYQWWLDCSRNGGNGVRTVGMDVTIEQSSCARNLGNGGSVDGGSMRGFEWSCVGNEQNGLVASNGSLRLVGGGITTNELAGALVRDVRDGSLDGVDASGNGGSGVFADSAFGVACGILTLTECVTNANAGDGVTLSCTTGGLIRRCESSGNDGAGFVVSGIGHVVIENVASGNMGGGFLIPIPDNTIATIVDEVGAETNTNPGANYVR